MNPVDPNQKRRNRTTLMLVAVMFFGAFLLAGALRFSGWRPSGMKNHGELLDPPGDLRQVRATLVDGSAYAWNPVERTWRVVIAPPAGCTTACERLATDLDKVWRLFGREADRVHILWLGAPPASATRDRAMRVLHDDPALRRGLPRVDDPAGIPVYVIDPNGFVILRYAPGFDPGDLRTDMSRLLKLK